MSDSRLAGRGVRAGTIDGHRWPRSAAPPEPGRTMGQHYGVRHSDAGEWRSSAWWGPVQDGQRKARPGTTWGAGVERRRCSNGRTRVMSDLRPNNGGAVPPDDGGARGGLPDLPPEWGPIVIPDDAAELDAEATEIRRELRREHWETRLRALLGLGPRRG